MIKIVKRYTIKFSYAGIAQYAEFNEQENGELVRPSLMVSYAKVSDIPDVSKMTKIEDVLEAVKKIAYGNRAEIEKINGMPVFYYKRTKTRKLVSEIEKAFDEFVEAQAIKFFNAELKPLLIKNKWKISNSHIGIPILIEESKEEGEEWQNISNKKKENEFEYLCEVFTKSVGIDGKKFIFPSFINLLPVKHYEEFYIKP